MLLPFVSIGAMVMDLPPGRRCRLCIVCQSMGTIVKISKADIRGGIWDEHLCNIAVLFSVLTPQL